MAKRSRELRRLAMWFAPNLIVAASFLGALWWIKPKNLVLVEVLTAAAAIFVLGYSLFIGNRESRRLDEVQRASWGFASGHGWVWGGFATIVLGLVPPVVNWQIDLVNAVVRQAGHGKLPPDATNHLALQLAFSFGGTLVMVMQTLAIIVAAVIWNRRMSR